MFTLRLNSEDDNLIRSYAALKGESVSEVLRKAILEKIEDEFDLSLAESALQQFKQNPKVYSLSEAKKELEI